MAIFGGILLGVLFLVELAALFSFGYWGYRLEAGWALRIACAIGLPALVAVFWGTFVAPKASIPVPETWRTVLQLAVFLLAATALYFSGRPGWAAGYAIIAVADAALVYVLKL